MLEVDERVARRRVRERSEEHTSELQSQSNLVCRLLLEKKKNNQALNHDFQYRDEKNQHASSNWCTVTKACCTAILCIVSVSVISLSPTLIYTAAVHVT